MGIIDLISNALGAIKGFFGWSEKRMDEKNAAPVVKAAIAKSEQKQLDAVNEAISNKNDDEIRNNLAE